MLRLDRLTQSWFIPHQFSGAFVKFRKATINFVMSIRLSAWNISVLAGRILMKFDMWDFFENLSRKFKFHYNPTNITGALHEDVSTSHLILLRMRNVLEKSCRVNKNTLLYSKSFSEYCTVYEIILKNIVQTEGPQMTSQYGAYALRAGLARLYAHMSKHKPTRPGTHMHARMHTHTYCFSTATMVSWTRLSVNVIQGGSNMTGTNCV